MDRIARAPARNAASIAPPTPRWTGSLELQPATKPRNRPHHRSRKQQRASPTDANASSKTGTQNSVPHVRRESDNRKARESRVLGSSRMLRILRGPPTSSAPPIAGARARVLGASPARASASRKQLAQRLQSPPGKGKRNTTTSIAPPTPRWTGSLEHTPATTPRNATSPIAAGSSRGTAQRTRTPQAKQARRSLFPTSGVNQTIEKRGSPEGPRPGPWGPPGEGKRV